MSPPLRDELSRLVIALFPFLLLWVRLFKFELAVTASAAPASNWLFLRINCPEARAELRNDPHDAPFDRGLFFLTPSSAAALLILVNHLRRKFADLKLSAHPLNLRCLLSELRRENLHSFLLLSNR